MSTPADWPMYVDADGQYGSAEGIVLFDHGQLTAEQWEAVDQLDGFDRIRYIEAVLDNDPLEMAYILGEDI